MKNLNIYVVSHKKIENIDREAYQLIRVGKNNKDLNENEITDSTGINIAEKNPNYCELTAMYWIWKNDNISDIVGITHYRRFFYKSIFNRKPNEILTKEEIQQILKEYDIIVPYPVWLISQTIEVNYAFHHYIEDLNKCREIISKKYPEYINSYDEVMKKHYIYSFNMLITKKEIYDEYMNWLFDILFEIEKITDVSKYDDYNKRLYGFLSERLFNVWLKKNGHLKKKRLLVYIKDRKSKNLSPLINSIREEKKYRKSLKNKS